MNIQFLQRELKHDELDKKGIELTGTYLMAVCLQAPRAWAQFKAIVAKAEELACAEESETVDERLDRLDAEYREALRNDDVPVERAAEIRRERDELEAGNRESARRRNMEGLAGRRT